MIEIEVRAKVDDFEIIKTSLENQGAKFVVEKRQVDKVFGREKDLDNGRMVIEGRFSARIRKVNDSIRVDFKEIIRGTGGMEVSANLSSIEQGQEFLEKLDYEEAFTIDKSRTEYVLDDLKICLDDVKSLGKFIEIEKNIENDHEKNKAYDECLKLLEKIVPDAKQEKRKYGDLIQDILNEKNEN